jgi:hypothetical protein
VTSSRCVNVTVPRTTLSSPYAQVLKDATQFFSRATPNLATVIPAMDYINDCLSARANDRSLSPAIKASLGLGKKTLNRYYSLTDSSEVYRIAMGTHLSLHLSYMNSNDSLGQSFTLVTSYCTSSPPSGNRNGLTLPRNWYAMNLNGLTNRTQRILSTRATPSLQRFANCLNIVFSANQLQISEPLPKLQNVFDNLPSLSTPPKTHYRDELARYLSTDPVAVDDVLMWWHEHSAMYPHLSRMARDYLTIPGVSRFFKLSVQFTHVLRSYFC